MRVCRKASLALIRKMVHYSSEVLLKEVCDSETAHNLPTVLVEITATVLDQEVSSHILHGCVISSSDAVNQYILLHEGDNVFTVLFKVFSR